MHCEKMAVTDMSFHQQAVTEFPVKKETWQESSMRYFWRPNNKAQNGSTPHPPKARRQKQYPQPAKLWELSFRTAKDAYWLTFWKKEK
jgi:hypothetical protein